MDITTAFEQSAARDPDRVAIQNPDGTACTYGDLHKRTTNLGIALDERIGHSRSGSLLRNGQPAIEILISAYKRGHANIPLNTQSSLEEQIFMLENGDVDCLIFDEENRERAVEIIEATDITNAFAVDKIPSELPPVDSCIYKELIASVGSAPDGYNPAGKEGGVYYTSGTTGSPKGVVATQEKSWYAATQLVADSGISPSDRALIATPLYHIVTSVSWTFAHLLANATLIPQSSFSPDATLDLVEEYDISNMFMIPTQWGTVLEEQAETPRSLDSVRQARTGGAPMDADTVSSIRDEVCEDFYMIYGLTESISNVTVGRPADHDRSPGTVGKATFNWEVRIVESTEPGEQPDPDSVVEPPDSGELLARSPVAADGYLDRPEAEKSLFVNEWIRTGDIARIDENRNLFIVDRVDNMIISGGENIYPQEVESVLTGHPGVVEAVAIAVPHEKWGETAKAIVRTDADLTPADLDEFCKDSNRLADFKRPRMYELVDEPLPRNPLGKFRRSVIQEEFGE